MGGDPQLRKGIIFLHQSMGIMVPSQLSNMFQNSKKNEVELRMLMKRIWINLGMNPQEMETQSILGGFLKIYDNLLTREVGGQMIEPVLGVRELLAFAKRTGKKVFVVTGGLRVFALAIIRKAQLTEFIPEENILGTPLTAESSESLPTKTDHVKFILQRMHREGEQSLPGVKALGFGDGLGDIAAYQGTHVPSVALTPDQKISGKHFFWRSQGFVEAGAFWIGGPGTTLSSWRLLFRSVPALRKQLSSNQSPITITPKSRRSEVREVQLPRSLVTGLIIEPDIRMSVQLPEEDTGLRGNAPGSVSVFYDVMLTQAKGPATKVGSVTVAFTKGEGASYRATIEEPRAAGKVASNLWSEVAQTINSWRSNRNQNERFDLNASVGRSEARAPAVQPMVTQEAAFPQAVVATVSAEVREQSVKTAGSTAGKKVEATAMQEGITAAVRGAEEMRFTEILPEIVNPLATQIDGHMIGSIMQSLNVGVISSLKDNGLHIIEYNPVDGFDGAYIAQRIALSPVGSRFMVIASGANETAAKEALKEVQGRIDLRIGQVNSLLPQAVAQELATLGIDAETAKSHRNVLQAVVEDGVDRGQLLAASALLNQFDGVVTVTGSRVKVSSAFPFSVAEFLGAAIQAAQSLERSA